MIEFSPEEKNIFREWLVDHLHHGIVNVTFTKKDGTERTMRCTLKADSVQMYEKKTERVKTINEDTCPVFDLDKQEWRSFRYDSITRVEFSIEPN